MENGGGIQGAGNRIRTFAVTAAPTAISPPALNEGPISQKPRSFPDPAVSIPFDRCRVVPFSYQSYHSPNF